MTDPMDAPVTVRQLAATQAAFNGALALLIKILEQQLPTLTETYAADLRSNAKELEKSSDPIAPVVFRGIAQHLSPESNWKPPRGWEPIVIQGGKTNDEPPSDS